MDRATKPQFPIPRYIDYVFTSQLQGQPAEMPLQAIICIDDQVELSMLLGEAYQQTGTRPQRVLSFSETNMAVLTAVPAFWQAILKHPNLWQVSSIIA